VHRLAVGRDHLLGVAHGTDAAGLQPHHPRALLGDLLEAVGGEQHSGAALAALAHVGHALLLEAQVADRDDLVEEQRVGLELRDDAEGQPQAHPVAVGAQRRVLEALELGELDRPRDDLARAARRHAGGDRGRHRVLAPREDEVEEVAEAEDRGGVGGEQHAPPRRRRQPGGQAQERRLPRAVLPHHADELAAPDRERDVAQRPALLARTQQARQAPADRLAQRLDVPARIGLPGALEADPVHAHRWSAKRSCSARKRANPAAASTPLTATSAATRAPPGPGASSSSDR
jgi:hypothetical protein